MYHVTATVYSMIFTGVRMKRTMCFTRYFIYGRSDLAFVIEMLPYLYNTGTQQYAVAVVVIFTLI